MLTREYVTDESGAIVKMVIPSRQPQARTYLVPLSATRLPTTPGARPPVTTHNGFDDLGFRFRYVGQYGVQDDATFGLPLQLMGARH